MANEIRDVFNAVFADGPTGSPSQPVKSRIRAEIGGIIQQQVDAKASSADLTGAVDGEKSQREAADTALGSRIDSVESIAYSNAAVYDSVAAGLAATTNGQQFQVPIGKDIVRYKNNAGVAVEISRLPSAEAVSRPDWAGSSIGWKDPFFRSYDLTLADQDGRRRYHATGGNMALWSYTTNQTFDGRALRTTYVGAPVNASGPRIYFDDLGATTGDIVTLKLLVVSEGASRVYCPSRQLAGFVPVGDPIASSPAFADVSGSPILFSCQHTVQVGADGLWVYPYINAALGDPARIVAVWAHKGTASDGPNWPIFEGEPIAADKARYASMQFDSGGRVNVLEDGQSYMLDYTGGVEPDVTPADIELAATDVVADATYGSNFRGWAQRYIPAGISFNAVRVRSLGRKSDVTQANWWRTIKVYVRASAAGDASVGAQSTLVAVGDTIVRPDHPVLEDVVIILRDPATGDVVTLDDSKLGAEYLIGTYAIAADGGPAYCSRHRATQANTKSPLTTYYITTQDPAAGNWIAVSSGSVNLGVDHLLLNNPIDVRVYEPTASFIEALGAAGAVSTPGVSKALSLRQFAARKAKGAAISIALLGDSWTNAAFRMHEPLRARFEAREGVNAPGWISANTDLDAPTGGTRTRTGTWANVRTSASALGPDNAHASTTDGTATLAFGASGAVAKYLLGYLQQPGGGSLRYTVGTGTPIVVDTNGTFGVQMIEISGPGALLIEIASAGPAGVTILGAAALNDTAGEIVLHKLGSGGAMASHFAGMPAGSIEAAYAAIAPDVVQVCLGTNDHAASVGLEAYRANIETIMDRIRAALPLVDIVLVAPGPNGNTGAYQIDDYIRVLYEISADKDCAFVNLKAAFGTYADANARGLYGDPSHPNMDGGKIIGKTIWNAFYEPV